LQSLNSTSTTDGVAANKIKELSDRLIAVETL